MKLDGSLASILFVFSLFCGIIIISLGFGAALPVINRVAAPFVCSNGEMQLESETHSYQPGQSTTTINWLCVDGKTGNQEDINFKVILVSGSIYGLILFALFVTRWLMVNRPGSGQLVTPDPAQGTTGAEKDVGSQRVLAKLQELRDLHSANLITLQEYEKKKAEILGEF